MYGIYIVIYSMKMLFTIIKIKIILIYYFLFFYFLL